MHYTWPHLADRGTMGMARYAQYDLANECCRALTVAIADAMLCLALISLLGWEWTRTLKLVVGLRDYSNRSPQGSIQGRNIRLGIGSDAKGSG